MTTSTTSLPLDLTAENVAFFAPTRQDIGFTHPIFVQCFLPIRKLRNDEKRFQTKHGRASLLIKAGDILNPATGDIEECDVPYGAAARIILAHINNHVMRAGSIDEAQEVPMGHSLRDFFRTHHLKIGGHNAKQITKQVQNIASAHIVIGLWKDDQARQINVPTLAEEISFWLEKDDNQKTMWQPTMLLNRKYVDSIKERAVPIDMRALTGLYEKPRAMDVFTWLSYRLPTVRDKKGVYIPFFGNNGLHGIFGKSLASKRLFKSEFLKTLKEVSKWYPDARITIEDGGIRAFYSPSPIPAEHSISKEKSLFFCS